MCLLGISSRNVLFSLEMCYQYCPILPLPANALRKIQMLRGSKSSGTVTFDNPTVVDIFLSLEDVILEFRTNHDIF